MKTLPTLIAALLVGAATSAAAAAEAPGLATITITAKQPHPSLAADRVPPQAAVEIVAPLPTDMPEAEVHPYIAPIGALPAPATARVTS